MPLALELRETGPEIWDLVRQGHLAISRFLKGPHSQSKLGINCNFCILTNEFNKIGHQILAKNLLHHFERSKKANIPETAEF
jgi:hypothetical protein